MEVIEFLKVLLQKVAINVKKSEMELFCECFSSTNQDLTKKYIADRKEEGKDLELSKLARKEGNIFFQEGKYLSAMILYHKSIELAPYDSLDHTLSVANRSAVLFELQRYEDCLVDINRVLVSKYPKLLMNKIFNRQAKCLLELKRYEAAVEVVTVFKLWFENEKIYLTQGQIDNTLRSINDIEKVIPVNPKTVESVEQICPAPSFTDGENAHFAYASKTVAFRKNRRLGRHVVANSNIKKGDILFVENPYSTSCTSTQSKYYIYCNQCFACSLTSITCKFCTDMNFCSEQCRELFWTTRHKWECAAIRKSLLCSEYSLALAILFRVSQTGFNSTMLQKNVYGNKDNNYPYVNQLATHIADMPLYKLSLNIKAAVFLVTYLIHFTDYFDWLYGQHNRPEESLPKLYEIVGAFLLKTLLQIDSNSEIVQYSYVQLDDKFSPGVTYHSVAHALFVSSSSINHSCVPNAVKSFHASTKIVKAVTDIPKGKEITICYIREPNIYEHRDRQKELKENYYFKCTCCVCNNNNELNAWLCNRCQGQALTSFAGTRARCQDCQNVFQLRKYKEEEMAVNLLLSRALFSDQFSTYPFKFSLTRLERIYFRDNYKFMEWYSAIVEYCDKVGDFQGCLEYIQSMLRIEQTVFGETAVIGNLNIFLRLCVSRVNYCLSMNIDTSTNYNKALKEATDSITHCADLLSYHMCPKLVDCFKENMLQILSAGSLDYDKTKLLFHFNHIPLDSEIRSKVLRPCNKLNFSFSR